MSKIYLTASYDGQIFEYSKDQKEGFVKHTSTTGKESYRKYYNKGVEGTLMNVDLRVNEKLNNMEELRVTLKQGDDYYIIAYPVSSQNGDIDEFTEQLIRVLPKMEKGTVYNIKNWFMKKGDVINGEEVKYNNKGVTVKCADTKIEPVLTYKTQNNPDGDIPMLEFKEFKGKKKLSAVSKEAKFEYLYDKLEEQVGRLKSVVNEQQSTTSPETPKNQVPTATPAQAFEPATNYNLEEHDDLPF